MELTPAFYLVALVSVLLTGISKSGFGGGLGVMSVPLMSLFVAPQFAAAVMMPILLAMDVLIVWRYRRTWSRPIVCTLLPAALLGLAIGSLLFQRMDADVIRLFIGLLAAVFVLQFVLSRRSAAPATAPPRPVVWGLGLISGFASFVAHAGGPPVKGYLLQQRLEKSWFVGTNTVYFFALNALKTVAYGAAGTMTASSLATSAVIAPMLVIGVALGGRLHRYVDQGIFVTVVYTFLALAAIRLLSDGAAAFL